MKILEREEARLKAIVQGCMGKMERLVIQGRIAATWKTARP